MKPKETYLVLDTTFTGKAVGTACVGAASVSLGGLTMEATQLACTFFRFANPELVVFSAGILAMGYAAHETSEGIAPMLGKRFGLRIREVCAPRWDITGINFSKFLLK
ncbi:MAG: hypothetical protein KGQ41_00590 [Alphaproteobacteria bacterium]|nr:hypothetical protein [Alphaproteobacteria bacterium]